MIVKFPNKKTLYVRCSTKCGTTSATSIIGYPRSQQYLGRQMKHKLREYNEWWPREELYPHDINKIDYNVAIIRNPVERLISCYKDRIVYKNRNNIRDYVSSWDFFVTNLDDIRNKYQDIYLHTTPQTNLTGKDTSIFDRIFLTKQISTEFVKYISKISETNVQHVHAKRTDNIVFEEFEITKTHIDIIKNFYKLDYKVWNNYFQ